MQFRESEQRYFEKTKDVSGEDPYESLRNQWIDVDSWPNLTYVSSKNPYTEDQLMNYKSLDCYQNFLNEWFREVFNQIFEEKRLLIAKVR